MYYKNLRAEMVRNGISKADILELLEISNNTYYSKMTGRTDFKLSEVEKILALFYRKTNNVYSVEYLFDTTIANGLKQSPDTSNSRGNK